ncbi:DLW-39 family protein [Nostocoides australiense]
MKKLLLVVATAVGASILKKNMERSRSEKDLWTEATTPSTTASAESGKDAWASATDTPGDN